MNEIDDCDVVKMQNKISQTNKQGIGPEVWYSRRQVRSSDHSNFKCSTNIPVNCCALCPYSGELILRVLCKLYVSQNIT